ncbi:AraC family transcriptional regulator [Thalassobacillus sp. CUG 92003]|uniref:AraC family transcriptional regulator n=1 Tax=Thalassobacillus sp. CUG 92003 TaxID=2736641 RepID=UPI0015E63720|nr:AraC family transcriptional regulator [Thalassobacillus sp. CUG 92003]
MTWVESLQKAIDYMEEHLLEDLSIDDIAREAHTSVFHFQRVFFILTDMTVGEYVRRRRLTQAACDLQRSHHKIIDIAYTYGYDTPEAFSKAFRKQHGVSPREARNYTGKLKSYNRLMIQVNLKGADPMQYKIVEQESFHITGLKREFSLRDNENLIEIPKMWQEVNENGTDGVLFELNNGPVKGVLGVCVADKGSSSQQMDYWIATAHEGDAPAGYSQRTIPASKWAVFEVHGPMPDAMQEAWKQIFSEWFPSSHYEHADGPELEVHPEEDPSRPDFYSEIWVPIK